MTIYRSRVSPSQINLFIECPSAWVLRYHYGYVSKWTDKMSLGTRFEDRVNCTLTSSELDNVTFELTDREIKAADLCAKVIKDIFGDKDFTLQKELKNDDLVGYVDYYNESHIVDLKTTSATPSTTPKNNLRQLDFYRSFFSQDSQPHLTLLFAVMLKKELRVLIQTTSETIIKRYQDYPGIYRVDPISEYNLSRAGLENINATRTIQLLRRHPDYINAIPINPNHFTMTRYDKDIIDNFLKGELVPFTSTYTSVV